MKKINHAPQPPPGMYNGVPPSGLPPSVLPYLLFPPPHPGSFNFARNIGFPEPGISCEHSTQKTSGFPEPDCQRKRSNLLLNYGNFKIDDKEFPAPLLESDVIPQQTVRGPSELTSVKVEKASAQQSEEQSDKLPGFEKVNFFDLQRSLPSHNSESENFFVPQPKPF